ncbi:MAG: RHS repeat-associated core domain-containing protein [Pyrinomonadaceae bacterium]
MTSVIDVDPWGGETSKSSNQAFQPHRYTSYERDGNSGDDAQQRRYQSYWMRFAQPDPTDQSYDVSDPQSFNRYSYTQNDPVNFVDPTGLEHCYDDGHGGRNCISDDEYDNREYVNASTLRWDWSFFYFSAMMQQHPHPITEFEPRPRPDRPQKPGPSGKPPCDDNHPSPGYLDFNLSLGWTPTIPIKLLNLKGVPTVIGRLPLNFYLPQPTVGLRVDKGFYFYAGANQASSPGLSGSVMVNTGSFTTGWNEDMSISGGAIVGGSISLKDGSWGGGITSPSYSAFQHVYVFKPIGGVSLTGAFIVQLIVVGKYITPYMTTAKLIAGIGATIFGIVILYFTQRNPVHPFFKTWWTKYTESPQTYDRLMGRIVGVGAILVGICILLFVPD